MSKSIYLSPSAQENNIGVLNYGDEERRMNEFVDRLIWYMNQGKGGIMIYRNNPSMSLAQIIEDSNAKSPDFHFSIHSNAGGAAGTEIYYFHENVGEGKRFAQMMYNAIAPITISADRGCMPDSVLYTNGLAELRETNAPASLIEIMFHDNERDVVDYFNKIELLALTMAKTIYEFFGITYNYISSEKERAIKVLQSVSNYANKVWIPEFEVLANRGLNIWGLILLIKQAED